MKKIAIMDTSVMSFNIGDQIIMESARRNLKPILDGNFVVNMPTHSPLFHKYEFSLRGTDSLTKNLRELDYKFVCGTNLLSKDMRKRKNSWNMHMLDLHFIRDFILVGVGTDELETLANNYTKKFYQKALSSDIIHSTRDEKTKQFLESIGIKAINTGCVTMWGLTEEHCAQIPSHKSDTVIFTITDYKPDLTKDRQMIETLASSYQHLYCWIQGSQDVEYISQLGVDQLGKDITYIPPSLEAYNDFLETTDCDFVGTRLHAGVKAMQKFKRAIIIGVDNRARDIYENYQINYLDRKDIDRLATYITSDFKTDVKMDKERIDLFLNQFN